MRDAMELEQSGIPTAVIVAQPLIGTAESVKRMLGNAAYPYCVMRPPIHGLSQQETQEQVLDLAPKLEGLLTSPPSAQAQRAAASGIAAAIGTSAAEGA